MPATAQDYSQIKEYKDLASSKTSQANQTSATAFSLSDNIMEAVRNNRTERGVSKLATDMGNVMGQMVSDPNAIRESTSGIVDPYSVNALTANARAQNLKTLGTVSTQLEQNQGSIDEVINAGANQLKSRAAMLLAEAEQASSQAQAMEDEYKRMMEERKQAWTEYMGQQQLNQKSIITLEDDNELNSYIEAVLNGGDLSTVPIKYRSIVDAATKNYRSSLPVQDQIGTLPSAQQAAARQALYVYETVQKAKGAAGYKDGEINVPTGPVVGRTSKTRTNTFGKDANSTYELDKYLSELVQVIRQQGTGVAFSSQESKDYIDRVGSTKRQEPAVASGLDYIDSSMRRKLATYGIILPDSSMQELIDQNFPDKGGN